jgi:hypothetical protein
MEGFGVKKIMETLKRHDINVTQVVHDKDSSTLRQVMEVYEDVEEALCMCMFIFLSNSFSTWLQEPEEADFKGGKVSSRAEELPIKSQQGNEENNIAEYGKWRALQEYGSDQAGSLLWCA